jgi:hypothetical protein
VLKIEMSAKATTRPQETSGSPHEEREGNKKQERDVVVVVGLVGN